MDDAHGVPVPPFIDSGEDWSIHEWWRRHPDPGWLWIEVAIGFAGPGDWPNPRSHRRIDAIHLPGHETRDITLWRNQTDVFAEAVAGRRVELVEAKWELSLNVIGQCIAGVTMLSRSYPGHGPIQQVAVVRGEPDPALRWICDRRNIEVHAFDHALIRSRKTG